MPFDHPLQLFTAYCNSENSSTHSSGPKAHKVSLDSTGGEDLHLNLPTPPNSPVFAELTTAAEQQQEDIKPDINKLNRHIRRYHQEGPQAVPNLEMNPPLTDSLYNLNTGKDLYSL